MNCTCNRDIEAKLLDQLKEETPTGVDQAVSLSGYGFVLVDNRMTIRPYTVVNRSVMLPKKGSEGWRQKRSTMNMFFSFCPYCGKSVLGEPDAVATESAEVVEGGAA